MTPEQIASLRERLEEVVDTYVLAEWVTDLLREASAALDAIQQELDERKAMMVAQRDDFLAEAREDNASRAVLLDDLHATAAEMEEMRQALTRKLTDARRELAQLRSERDELGFLLNGVDDALNGHESEFQASFPLVLKAADVKARADALQRENDKLREDNVRVLKLRVQLAEEQVAREQAEAEVAQLRQERDRANRYIAGYREGADDTVQVTLEAYNLERKAREQAEAEVAQLRQERDAARGAETLANQWTQHAEREEALADARVEQLEAQLATAREALEQLADWLDSFAEPLMPTSADVALVHEANKAASLARAALSSPTPTPEG